MTTINKAQAGIATGVSGNGHNGHYPAAELTDLVILDARLRQETIEVPRIRVAVPWNSQSTALASVAYFTITGFYPLYGPPGEQARPALYAAMTAPDQVGVLKKHAKQAGYHLKRAKIDWVEIPNPFFHYEGMRNA